MGAKVIILGEILNSNFLKGLRHSALIFIAFVFFWRSSLFGLTSIPDRQ